MANLPTRYRRTIVTSYLNAATQAFVALLITPLLARNLGTTGYGIWALVGSLILYLELLEFGFAQTTIKFVAEYEALGDRQAVRRAIATSVGVLAVPGVLALGVGGGMAWAFPYLFRVDPTFIAASRVVVLVLAVDLALSIPADTFGGVLIAFQRYDLLNLTLISVALSQSLGWAIVIWTGHGLVLLAVVGVTLSLIGQILRYVMARRLVPGMSLSRRMFDRSLVRPFAGLSVWFGLRNIAEIIFFRIDTIIVGLVVGVPAAGIYAVGQKLALLTDRFVSPATTSFFPYSAELTSREDAEGLRAAVTTGTRISLAIAGPLCLTLAILARPGILAWVGVSFAGAAPVVILLSIATAVKSLNKAGIHSLSGMGRPQFPAIVFIGESVVNVTLSVILGRWKGLAGVAWATLIATSLSELVFILPHIAAQLGLSVPGFLRRTVLPHLPALAVGSGVGWALTRTGLDGVLPVLGAAIVIFGSYLLTFSVTGVTPAERRRLAAVLRRKRGRRPQAEQAPEPEGGPQPAEPAPAGRLQVLLVDPSPRGGIAEYTELVARSLAKAGGDVTVLACRNLPDAPVTYPVRRLIPEWSWSAPERRKVGFYLGRASDWAQAALAVRRTAAAIRPHVVNFEAPLNRRLDVLLLRSLRRNTIVAVTAHDVLPPERKPRDVRHFAAIYRSADLLIIHNQAAAEEMKTLCGKDAVIIDQPVRVGAPAGLSKTEARRRLGLVEDGLLFSAVGFIRPYKGYDLLADVWDDMGATAPRLLVMGEVLNPNEQAVLDRLAAWPQVVMRLGYATSEDFELAITASDALLLPYRSSSGSGLVRLARALGRPVIATDAPQLAEDIRGSRAGIVVPRNVQAWRDALSRPLPPPPPPPPPEEAVGETHLRAYLEVCERARADPSRQLPPLPPGVAVPTAGGT